MANKRAFGPGLTPIVLLSVSSQNIEQTVLDSHAGEALAFGAGMLTHTNNDQSNDLSNDPSNGPSTSVIAGHRDTHFQFLKHIKLGAVVTLQRLGEKKRHYRISA